MSGKLRLLPAQQIAVTIFKPILIDYTLFVNAFPSPEEVQKLWFQEMPLRMVADPPLPSYFDPSMLREVATPFQELLAFLFTPLQIRKIHANIRTHAVEAAHNSVEKAYGFEDKGVDETAATVKYLLEKDRYLCPSKHYDVSIFPVS